MIVILPDMLLIRLTLGAARELPWSNISRITPNRGNMAVSAFIRDTKTVETIGGIFRSKAEAFEFANRATMRIQGAPPAEMQGSDSSLQQLQDDPHAVVVELKKHRDPIPQWGVFPIVAIAVLTLFGAPLSLRMRALLFLLLLVIAAGAALYLVLRTPKVAQRLTINRSGVMLGRGDEDILRLPWAEIRGSTLSRMNGLFRIEGEGGQILFICSSSELGRFKMLAHCAQEITRLREVYSNPADLGSVA